MLTIVRLVLFLSLFPALVNAQVYEIVMWPAQAKKDPRIARSSTYMYEYELKEDCLDGDYRVYLDSTKQKKYLTGTIQNRKRIGNWIYYHPNGLIKVIVPYSNGQRHGLVPEFSYSGDTVTKTEWSYGECLRMEQCNSDFDNTYGSTAFVIDYPTRSLTIRNDYYGDGKLYSIDSFNYSACRRHTLYFTHYGEIIRDVISGINDNAFSRPIRDILYDGLTPSTTYTLHLNLDEKRDWEKLDSLKYYTNLHRLSIRWDKEVTFTTEVQEELEEKLLALKHLLFLDEFAIWTRHEVPEVIYELKNLKILIVTAGTPIHSKIGQMSNLEFLSYCLLTNDRTTTWRLPNSLKQLKSLRTLSLESYRMARPNKELRKLKSLEHLENLSLNYCGITVFPKVIVNFLALRSLTIVGTYQNGQKPFNELPDIFFTQTQLRHFIASTAINEDQANEYRSRLPLCEFEFHYMDGN